MAAHGTGPGHIAPDGSAVEFYASLPDDDESAALIHDAIPGGASILELGSGTGRMTRPLLAYGHPVVAVDHSAEMLAHIRTETVRSSIEELALGRTFDAVVLASYIIQYADVSPGVLLDVCRTHVAAGGSRHPATPAARVARLGAAGVMGAGRRPVPDDRVRAA
jgi:SAM-dependent methyltransferase